MNAYHPALRAKSEALLYIDAHGPYPTPDAVQSGFELWKRNSNAQVGDSIESFRKVFKLPQYAGSDDAGIDRQQKNDEFISYCRDCGDALIHDSPSTTFPSIGSSYVLFSGSLLHRSYLCFLWHPALEEVRQFVRDHPTHRADLAVSTIVTQLSGRSPIAVHLRSDNNDGGESMMEVREFQSETSSTERFLWHRKEWDDRTSMALDSLVSYFGSLPSGNGDYGSSQCP
jgi:hypothetical protein